MKRLWSQAELQEAWTLHGDECDRDPNIQRYPSYPRTPIAGNPSEAQGAARRECGRHHRPRQAPRRPCPIQPGKHPRRSGVTSSSASRAPAKSASIASAMRFAFWRASASNCAARRYGSRAPAASATPMKTCLATSSSDATRATKKPIVLSKLEAQAPPRNLEALKIELGRRWPMTSLLDML